MAFPREERPTREPFLNVPSVVVALIGVLVAAHALRVLGPAWIADPINEYGVLTPVVYSSAKLHALGFTTVDPLHQVLPPLGHLFLHADLTHLTVNSVWLLAFGPVVARRFGAFGFLNFFFLCGLAGAAAFVGIEWGQNVGAIGASGAISGLTAAAIRMLQPWSPWPARAGYPLAPLYSPQVLGITVVWMGLNLVSGIIGLGPGGTFQAIAWQDHLGGFLAGLLLAGPFDRYFGRSAPAA
jgi:membrane associated rhomboid family serine protease